MIKSGFVIFLGHFQFSSRGILPLLSHHLSFIAQRLHENRNVCADALYRLAVANSDSLPAYGLARELLLDDAVGAAERNVQRLQSLQRRLEDLGLILKDRRQIGRASCRERV